MAHARGIEKWANFVTFQQLWLSIDNKIEFLIKILITNECILIKSYIHIDNDKNWMEIGSGPISVP